MAIQVRCPNEDCGKILSVRDEFAGKTGRCPSCGATLPIPNPTVEDVRPVSAAKPRRRDEEDDEGDDRPARPTRRRPVDEDDEDEGPRRPARRRRDDDYDDEDDDDYDDRPRRRRSREDDRRRRRRSGSDTATPVCLGIGIGLLVFLSLIPLFSLVSVSASGLPFGARVPSPPSWFSESWQGKVLLIVSILAALLTIAALILHFTVDEGVSGILVTIGSCVGSGWGIAALLWIVGQIWKIFTQVAELKGRMGGLAERISISPSIGLWLGMAVAVGVVVVFSTLLSLRRQSLWLYVAEGSGVLLGVLLVVAAVQPWKAG